MDTIKTVLGIFAFILVADAIAFVWWSLSGQHPIDDFFIGTITYHLILWL